MRTLPQFLLFAVVALANLPMTGFGQVIYVDNLRGSDASDGKEPAPINLVSGPVRTIRRGLQLLQKGGTLNLANNNQPYYESMELVGRSSGTALRPTLIEGNGVELNGSFPVPPNAWRKVGKRLWKFTPLRKGHFVLIVDNKPLPETMVPPGSRQLPKIPDGNWAAWKGSIYYQASPVDEPADFAMWYAVRSVGITLYETHDVTIRNLKVRHFRIDGINAHDRCNNILLDNVTAEENGRAGVAVAGTSFVTIKESTIKNNRLYSVLILEKAGVQVDEKSQIDPPPKIAD